MSETVAKTKITPQSKKQTGSVAKKSFRVRLKSSQWHLSASRSIAIERGEDYRDRHHWLRLIGQARN